MNARFFAPDSAIRLACAALLCLAAGGAVFAQESQPGADAAASTDAEAPSLSTDEALEHLRGVSREIDNWSGDIAMQMLLGGMPIGMSGHTKNEGAKNFSQFNMDMMGQSLQMKTVTDPQGVIWTEMDMMGQTTVMKLDLETMKEEYGEEFGEMAAGGMGMNPMGDLPATTNPEDMIDMMAGLDNLRFKGEEAVGGAPTYVLEGDLSPATLRQVDPSGQLAMMGVRLRTMELALGKDDAFPRRMVLADPESNPVMVITYENVKIGEDFDDALFSYTPPEGVEPMDLASLLEGEGMAGLGGALGGGEAEGLDLGQLDLDSSEMDFNTKLQVGEPAPAFEAPTLSGDALSLSDQRGKVVLLDFWASWAGPSLEQMPSRIAAYSQYHDQGFEIVGVNMDSEKDRDKVRAWLAEKDGVVWPQVFDGRGWDSPIAEKYGVNAIPYSLLLDRTGTIRHVNLKGQDLMDAVKALLEEEASAGSDFNNEKSDGE